jgi:hypothetical protein
MKHGVLVEALLLVAVVLFVSCPTKACSSEMPEESVFKLVQTKIDVVIADFDSALYRDTLGYPRVDFKKWDRETAGKVVKTYNAVVLTVAQPLSSPNKLGWWFALGGVEYTMPADEHGETWAATWDWEVVEDSDKKKTVKMKVKELRYGLEETIDISICPDKAYYEAAMVIVNPTDKPVDFQHWINPMWVPGGQGEITPHTEFIMPTEDVHVTERKFNDWMLDYHPDKSRRQCYVDGPLRFLLGWKSIGDLLACELEHGFYSAFSHDENEGIVRVFAKEKNPGCNIWAWGINPKPSARKRFSGSEECRGYVEMWGGITHGFDKYYRLDPGESVSWTEWMYPYSGTEGLHYANKDFAVTFTCYPDGEHILRFCPSGDLCGVECDVVSVETKEVCGHMVCDSICAKRQAKELILELDESVELVIVQDGKEVVRLPARNPPVFPEQ